MLRKCIIALFYYSVGILGMGFGVMVILCLFGVVPLLHVGIYLLISWAVILVIGAIMLLTR